jgi:hypothetical protein
MRRYYFDWREGDEVFPDEEGLELSTIEEVQEEAARSLADMMRDVVHQHLEDVGYPVAIEVRDDDGPVLQLKFTFEPGRRK